MDKTQENKDCCQRIASICEHLTDESHLELIEDVAKLCSSKSDNAENQEVSALLSILFTLFYRNNRNVSHLNFVKSFVWNMLGVKP